MAQSIDEIIGWNLSELRKSNRLSQDDLAGAARIFGLRWNSARISRMERGESGMTVETLLSLCIVMSEATGDPIQAVDLLATPEDVTLGPTTVVPARNINLLVSNDPQWWAGGNPETVAVEQRAPQPGAESLWAAYESVVEPGPVDLKALAPFSKARRQWSLTDERNARKLDLTDEEFVIWCVQLWGQLMSQETEDRAPEGATAQKRGRITRELLAELREALEQHGASDE